MSFPTLRFDAADRERGIPSPVLVERAVSLFAEFGALRLHDVFTSGFLESIRDHFTARYRLELSGTSKTDLRPLYTVDVEGPIADPRYYTNPMLAPIIERILGKDFVLGACSAVISFPGAPEQFVHRDSQSLFGNFSIDVALPSYALTLLVPMVDFNSETGSTRIWPGSHLEADFEAAKRMPSESPDVPFGSVLMTDSRVVHCGSPNRSSRVRPVLYNSYHRHWFRDWGGYESRPPVQIGTHERSRVSSELDHLFRIADETRGMPDGFGAAGRRVRSDRG